MWKLLVKRYAVVLWTALLMERVSCTTEEQEGVWAETDTYLDTYTNSHVTPDFQTNSLSPVQTYGIPFPPYRYPGPNFHPPYDFPSGPTGPSSPSGPSAYGAPFSSMYGAPYPASEDGNKGLPAGLDFATVCKIILKVLIFKMIVKFIAVICVLLFLPKLDSGGSSAGDSKLLTSRNDMGATSDGRLDRLTRLILESVENNATTVINENCVDDVHCKRKSVGEHVDNYNTALRLFTKFLLEFGLNPDHSRGKG